MVILGNLGMTISSKITNENAYVSLMLVRLIMINRHINL